MTNSEGWQDFYTLSSQLKRLASGVIAIFKSDCLTLQDNGGVVIPCDPQAPDKESLKEWANGTGFLVGESLVATAGHVLGIHGNDIFGKYFLFGYEMTAPGKINVQFPASKALTAETLVDSQNFTDIDWALLTLDQPAPASAQVLTINEQDNLQEGTEVFVMGHPLGLPTKYTGKGQVTEVNDKNFTISSPIYLHHSGSPVFNTLTGKVEGIVFNANGQCYKICQLTELISNHQD
jgi:V8-like Glu-specific endopeptidase